MRKISSNKIVAILSIFVISLFIASVVLPSVGIDYARGINPTKRTQKSVDTSTPSPNVGPKPNANEMTTTNSIDEMIKRVEKPEKPLEQEPQNVINTEDMSCFPENLQYELEAARDGYYEINKPISRDPTNLRVGRLMTRTQSEETTLSESEGRGTRATPTVDILGASSLASTNGLTGQNAYSGITVVVNYANAGTNWKLNVSLLEVGTNKLVGRNIITVSGTNRVYVTVYNDYDFAQTNKSRGNVGATLNKGEYKVYAKARLVDSSGTLKATDEHTWSGRGLFGFSLIPQKAKQLWEDVKEKCKSISASFDLKELFKAIFKFKKYVNTEKGDIKALNEIMRYQSWLFKNANANQGGGLKAFLQRLLKADDLIKKADEEPAKKAEFQASFGFSPKEGIDLAFGFGGKIGEVQWYLVPGLWGVIWPTISLGGDWSIGLGFKYNWNNNGNTEAGSLFAGEVTGGGGVTIGIGASIAGVAEVGLKVKLEAKLQMGTETEGIVLFFTIGLYVYGKLLKFVDLSAKLTEWQPFGEKGLLLCSYKTIGNAANSVFNWFKDAMAAVGGFLKNAATAITNFATAAKNAFINTLKTWMNSYIGGYYAIPLIARGEGSREEIEVPPDTEIVEAEPNEYLPYIGDNACMDFYEIELSDQNHPYRDMPLIITLSYDHDAPPPDVKLYIKKGEQPSFVRYDKASGSGSLQTKALIVPSPENTRWVLMVATRYTDGNHSTYNLTINCNYSMPSGDKLNLNEEASGTVDVDGLQAPPCYWYYVEVPKGQGIRIELDGPGTFANPSADSDIDLYVFRGAKPNETCFEFRGFNSSSDAVIEISAEESFSYFSTKDPYYLGIMVDAYKGVSGYTICVRTI